MCGLVGIAGRLQLKDESLMQRLLLLDYFRGPDSTGIAAIRDNGDVKIAKVASNPIDLFNMTSFKAACVGTSSQIFLGHNRASTRGATNSYNAHPYEFGHIVGAHNGTLDYQATRDLEDNIGEMFAVDSQAVFASIEKFGIDETMTRMKGAWSLTWWDGQAKTFNFLRNKERPMWYGFSESLDKIIWASEWHIIDSAVKMTPDFKMFKDDKGHSYWSTSEDTLYTFDLADLKKNLPSDGIPECEKRELKGKEPTPVKAGEDPFSRVTGGVTNSTGSSWKNNQSNSATKRLSQTDVVHLVGCKEDPFAGLFSEQKFCEIAQYGCSWCSKDVAYTDIGVTIYDRDEIVLCADCSGPNKQTKIIVPDLRIVK